MRRGCTQIAVPSLTISAHGVAPPRLLPSLSLAPSLSTTACPLPCPIVFSSPNVVRMLIACGASLNMQDKNGTTALHFAISSNNQGAVKALIEAGASVDVSDTQDHSPRDILNDFTSENPNIGYMRRFLPPSPPDTFPGNLIYPEPNRRIILVLTPYVGLVGIGLAA